MSSFPHKPVTSFSIKEISFGRKDQISGQEKGEKNHLFKNLEQALIKRGNQFSAFQLRFVKNPVTCTFAVQFNSDVMAELRPPARTC